MCDPLILRHTGSQNLSLCVTRNDSMIRWDSHLAQRHIPAVKSRRPAVLFCLHRQRVSVMASFANDGKFFFANETGNCYIMHNHNVVLNLCN